MARLSTGIVRLSATHRSAQQRAWLSSAHMARRDASLQRAARLDAAATKDKLAARPVPLVLKADASEAHAAATAMAVLGAEAAHGSGVALAELGRMEEARARFEMAISLDASRADALATSDEAQARREEAEETRRRWALHACMNACMHA